MVQNWYETNRTRDRIKSFVRAPVHGDQGFRLEGTTVSGG
jgi:hypothetical protein